MGLFTNIIGNIINKISGKGKDKTAAIILCAGSGKRMGTDTKKQFMEIDGKPVIYYSIKAFEESSVNDIVIVTGEEDIEYVKTEIIEKFGFKKIKAVVSGGKERYNSVFNGLKALAENDSDGDMYVLIHDGARPFVDNDIISRAIKAVKDYGAAVVGMPVKDTIKVVDANDFVVDTPNRSTLWQIQTPQCFDFKLAFDAYSKLIDDEEAGRLKGVNITDDAMVVEKYTSKNVKLVKGSYENIKITTPEDLKVAEVFI